MQRPSGPNPSREVRPPWEACASAWQQNESVGPLVVLHLEIPRFHRWLITS